MKFEGPEIEYVKTGEPLLVINQNARPVEVGTAIEELNRYVQQMEKLRKEGWYLEKTEMSTYGNAIMTMPLPESPKEGKI